MIQFLLCKVAMFIGAKSSLYLDFLLLGVF